MAFGIVDHLEIIDVHVGKRDGFFAALCGADRTNERFIQVPYIQQPRERVGFGQHFKLHGTLHHLFFQGAGIGFEL